MKFYTVEETGDILKVEPETVKGWIRTGRLRGSRLSQSKVLRVSEADINRFYEDNIVKPSEGGKRA